MMRVQRVMVSETYAATTPERAQLEYGITPDVIFVRRDEWKLGAPLALADQARACWSSEWKQEWRIGDDQIWRRVK